MTDPALPDAAAATPRVATPSRRSRLIDRILGNFADTSTPFELVLPDGRHLNFGAGAPSFSIILRDSHAMRAVASMDEGRIGDAYVEGHIDFEGDILRLFEVRGST